MDRRPASSLRRLRYNPPRLGPLGADNGSTTETFALLEGSPVIDAAEVPDDLSNAIEFEQRDEPFNRIIDGDEDGTATPDIGAF